MTTEAKTERPAMPIRPPIDAFASRDLAVVPEGARPTQHKTPSLREIQNEVSNLKVHLDRIIGQLKALSDHLNQTIHG